MRDLSEKAQKLSEKVQELEARLDELAEIDTLRARVKVLEEHVRGRSCGGELVEGAKVDGAKDVEGKKNKKIILFAMMWAAVLTSTLVQVVSILVLV